MSWLDTVLDRLKATTQWSYLPGGPRAAEPAALSAIALAAHGQTSAAHAALDWLVAQQEPDGAIGAVGGDPHPAWTTAWGLLAWQVADAASSSGARRRSADRMAIARGVAWLLGAKGETSPRDAEVGHDSSLAGWPWVQGTHSWVEPTALAVLALRASDQADHPRAVEGVRLLADRLLAGGGCNYGNTTVLGQELRPHVQPTGLCLWALAGTKTVPRVARSLDYLNEELASQLATASLSYGLLGLAAHGQRPASADVLLARAAERTLRRAPSAYRLALLALAAAHPAASVAPDTRGNARPPLSLLEVPTSTSPARATLP